MSESMLWAVRRCYARGDTMREIGERIGADRTTVGAMLRHAGVRQPRPARYPPEARWRVLELHARGASVPRIITETGVGEWSVRRWIKEGGQ